MEKENRKILVLYAHPTTQKSRVNAGLVKAISNLEGVTIRDLYELYPDFHIDVKAEQQLLTDHDIIIWQHPFYWYSAPPILKEWIDIVLEHGFAYGMEGNVLKGKFAMTVTTTGGSKEAYSENGRNRFTISQFLAPFEQTARLCKMTYLPPFVVHGSLILNEEDVNILAEDYRRVIVSLRDSLFSEEELMKNEYMNSLIQ